MFSFFDVENCMIIFPICQCYERSFKKFSRAQNKNKLISHIYGRKSVVFTLLMIFFKVLYNFLMIKLIEIQKLLLASIFIAMIENKIKQMSNKKIREK